VREEHPRFNSIQEGFENTTLSVYEAWLAYYALGGTESSARVGDYLKLDGDLDRAQQMVLAQAINEFFMDQGRNHPVPYPAVGSPFS
jgi:hypothetical protein